MTRFSIREFLLLMVIVGLGIGWWLHARRSAIEAASLRAQVAQKELVTQMLAVFRQNERDVMMMMQPQAQEVEKRLTQPGDRRKRIQSRPNREWRRHSLE